MKKIILFSKSGRLVYIGHLDLLRVFQRAFVRAGIDLCFSEGFNPHPLMSFAAPLSLGYSGKNEILEVLLEKEISDDALLGSLSPELPKGLELVSCHTASLDKRSAMADLAAAKYVIFVDYADKFEQNVLAFLEKPEIPVRKTAKVKGRKQWIDFDYKPLILSYETGEGYVCLFVQHNSEAGFNPDSFMESFQKDYPEYSDYRVLREELYYIKDGSYEPMSTYQHA